MIEQRFTVVSRARRGVDRSPLDGPVPDGAARVAADVADAAARRAASCP